MDISSLPKGQAPLSQMKQATKPRKDRLLFRSSAFGCKCVAPVSGETAWEIAAVVGIVSARHPNLIPRIDFRDAPQSHEQGKGQFQLPRCCSALAHETLRIVIA